MAMLRACCPLKSLREPQPFLALTVPDIHVGSGSAQAYLAL
jgi:hypothetical protein